MDSFADAFNADVGAIVTTSWSKEAAVLKLADIQRAMERIRDSRPTACDHAVHPKAQGWSICGMCGGPVWVEKARLP